MRKTLVSATAALAFAAFATPSLAAKIVLNDLGGVTAGTDAYQGFSIAAAFWGSRLTNNVTINLDVGFQQLGPNILGQTRSSTDVVSIEQVRGQLQSGGNSQLDAIAGAHLSSLTPGAYGVGALGVITSGALAYGEGVNTGLRVFDNDFSVNNSFLNANTANLKALGIGDFGNAADGGVTFSNQFAFDFNPADGISAGSIDFLSVAIHEIGHALGFVSGVDTYDYFGEPNGPWGTYDNLNDYAVASVLDLYRYSAGNPAGLGGGTQLDWSVGSAAFFSIDGQTPYGGGYSSTGRYNGDGRQASHWKDNLGLGQMDPTISYGDVGIVTSLDLAAMDAIGWNIDYDVFNSGRTFSTKDIYLSALSAVPEPATWAMMIAGFFMAGGAVRRRRDPAFA